MIERGVIRYRNRKRQIVDFRGMKFGTITPTDLDMLIDYHNDRFVFGELKHRDTAVEYGQKTAVVRLVDLIEIAGKRAVFFVATHHIDNPAKDIPADRCLVRASYERGIWQEATTIVTLREATDMFLGFCAPEYAISAPKRLESSISEPYAGYHADVAAWLKRAKTAPTAREPGEEG